MNEDFIEDLELDFVESPDTGDFWGGVDEWEDQEFEIFFTAGPEGPSSLQVQRYESFYDHLGSIRDAITSQFRAHVAVNDPGALEKWRQAPLLIDIVSFFPDNDEKEIDVCCHVSRGLFARRINFVAGLRSNQIVTFDVV